MKVKICGITRPFDARMAEAAGAGYVGAVLVPESRRCIEARTAAQISDAVEIPLVVVVANRDADELAQLAGRAGASAIQLHGDEGPEIVTSLREHGDWELWKAVRVRSSGDVHRAIERFGSAVDLLLFDGWHAHKLGGTGQVFPWEALESERSGLPAGLRIGVAGGLTSGNVAEAVDRLAPDLVDVSSGVESRPGAKDAEQVSAFLHAVSTAAGGRSSNAG